MTLPASVATVLLAPDIIGILLGARWGAAAPVLAILGIGVFLRLAYKVSSTVVLAYGASWRSALREGVYATLVVGGSILGMRDGLTGIAWAVLLALAWQFWAQTQLALTIIGGKWASLAAALVPLFLATAAAATGGVLADALLGPLAGHWARLIVVGAAIGAPYCLCLWLLRQTETVASLVRASTTLFRRHGAAEVEATQRLELRSREETV
jgi:PST family polysaccharide transporter